MEGMYKVCEVKLTYSTKVKSSERAVIRNSCDAYSLLSGFIYDSDTIQYREYLKLILLNRANKVLGVVHLSEGGTSETNADIKISIGHNNPNSESGNPNADNDHKSVSNLILHPTADIALVKLSAPVTFTDKIAPIYISNTQSYANNTICEIAG